MAAALFAKEMGPQGLGFELSSLRSAELTEWQTSQPAKLTHGSSILPFGSTRTLLSPHLLQVRRAHGTPITEGMPHMLHLILSIANFTTFGMVIISEIGLVGAVRGSRPRYLWATALRLSHYALVFVWFATAALSLATHNYFHAALGLVMGFLWLWIESKRDEEDDMFTGMGTKIRDAARRSLTSPQTAGAST